MEIQGNLDIILQNDAEFANLFRSSGDRAKFDINPILENYWDNITDMQGDSTKFINALIGLFHENIFFHPTSSPDHWKERNYQEMGDHNLAQFNYLVIVKKPFQDIIKSLKDKYEIRDDYTVSFKAMEETSQEDKKLQSYQRQKYANAIGTYNQFARQSRIVLDIQKLRKYATKYENQQDVHTHGDPGLVNITKIVDKNLDIYFAKMQDVILHITQPARVNLDEHQNPVVEPNNDFTVFEPGSPLAKPKLMEIIASLYEK